MVLQKSGLKKKEAEKKGSIFVVLLGAGGA